jgi:hypothetical protein
MSFPPVTHSDKTCYACSPSIESIDSICIDSIGDIGARERDQVTQNEGVVRNSFVQGAAQHLK